MTHRKSLNPRGVGSSPSSSRDSSPGPPLPGAADPPSSSVVAAVPKNPDPPAKKEPGPTAEPPSVSLPPSDTSSPLSQDDVPPDPDQTPSPSFSTESSELGPKESPRLLGQIENRQLGLNFSQILGVILIAIAVSVLSHVLVQLFPL